MGSTLLDIGLSNGTARITFPTQSGRDYRLEHTTNPTLPAWTTVTNVPGDGTDTDLLHGTTTTTGSYRIDATW